MSLDEATEEFNHAFNQYFRTARMMVDPEASGSTYVGDASEGPSVE